MKNWLDFSLAWSVARSSEVFAACGMGRKIHEKLLDLPDGLVVFSAADVEIDEPEGREIAGKAAWKGAPDLLEGFLVGCLADQLANAGTHDLPLGLRFPRPLRRATPEWHGSCPFFARRSRRSAAGLRVSWRHLLTELRRPVKIGRARSRLPIAAWTRACISLPRSVTSELGNSVCSCCKYFKASPYCLCPVQRCTEEEIGIVEQFGLWRGGQKTTEYGDGFFSLTCVDQALRLVQRRMVRRAYRGRFCIDGGPEPNRFGGQSMLTGKCMRNSTSGTEMTTCPDVNRAGDTERADH